MVGQGACAFAEPSTFKEDELVFARQLFEALGLVISVKEADLPAVTGISGSGPAYGFLFIEALAEAGVQQGLSWDISLKLAAKTLLGSAEMVLQTGTHPAALKNAVCSPGGTTIDAIAAFEKNGIRSAVFDAVNACVEKAKKL